MTRCVCVRPAPPLTFPSPQVPNHYLGSLWSLPSYSKHSKTDLPVFTHTSHARRPSPAAMSRSQEAEIDLINCRVEGLPPSSAPHTHPNFLWAM